MSGLIELPVWGYIVVTLVLTHITIAAVTIYLHRHQAHRALDLHPVVSHFFRFWLWLTTGMDTKQWVAIHRKHHARVETPEDPHSPQIEGIGKVLLEGTELYRKEAKNAETMVRFGHGTPDDWIERNLYRRHTSRGYVLMLLIDVALFGPIGITMWAVQMLWIPVLAAGVINGIGHWGGYRKFETADASTNIMPWGLLIGGEELHNNHHAYASSAKFSVQWWEFDLGWLYIRVLELLGLARVKKLPPKTVLVPGKRAPDADTLAAVITNRLQVMSNYARTVLARVYREELRRADGHRRNVLKRARSLLGREESRLSAEARKRVEAVLDTSHALKVSYQFKRRLQAIWQERTASHEGLIRALQDWCREAEATGIRALQDFARTLPAYSMPAASAA
ncbi:MAG TPA: fatty acid desaturase [Gammaproteobacteria bacterium]|nr:fatty acid desaturase [Gammaproteobacteria bacterium]